MDVLNYSAPNEPSRVPPGPPDRLFAPCRIRTVEVDKLRPHPAYLRNGLTVSASKIAALMALGDFAFKDPLVITAGGVILDGYGRWELAKQVGRTSLPCIEYQLADEDSVRCLLKRHRRLKGFNDFTRILLAFELEANLRIEASSNQRIGGQFKGSSNLTEATRIDVRKEIAAEAGVSVGNVTKVKQILACAVPELLSALRSSQVSIHMAWQWSKLGPSDQIREVQHKGEQRAMRKFIHKAISRHRKARQKNARNAHGLVAQLSACDPLLLEKIDISIVKTRGKTLFMTEELAQILNCRQMPICDTYDR